MPSFDTEVPVLLLRLDPNPFHHGSLGAIRSLGRTGIEVHVAQTARGPVDRSRYVRRVHPLALQGTSEGISDRVSDAALGPQLLGISDAIGRPAVLIPLDDRGAIAVDALAGQLRGRFLLPAAAPGLPLRVADKAELAGLCRATGIAHPRTVAPGSAAEAEREAAALGPPVVAKWSRPWLLAKGQRSTSLLRTAAEARELYAHGAGSANRLLLQQRLDGGPGTDWFFHGYAAGDGGFLVGGAGRKERSWPPRTGLTAVGTWIGNRKVERAAARLAAHVGYRGILDLDFRLDPATGEYHLLDFNPRPGAQFRLFTDDAGLDVVRAQHLHLTGRPVPAQCGGPGRVFFAENYALLSALAGGLAALGARSSAGSPQRGGGREPGTGAGSRGTGARRVPRPARKFEYAWLAADDARPFFAMAGAWAARGASKFWLRVRPAGAVPPAAGPEPQSAPQIRTTRDERSVKDQREGNACTTS